MDDLISRQAAIDALKRKTFRLTFAEEQNCEGHVAWSADAVYGDVMEGELLELPSAQPEQRWIPCSERLPDDDRTKVVTLANGNAEAGYYSNGDWWCIGDTISLENPIVIAWMLLPEPYKEGEHETD